MLAHFALPNFGIEVVKDCSMIIVKNENISKRFKVYVWAMRCML
jgi:hypothetical protein